MSQEQRDAAPTASEVTRKPKMVVQTADVQKQFIDLGLIPIGKGSLEELEAYTRSEVTRWSKVINDAGIAGTQ